MSEPASTPVLTVQRTTGDLVLGGLMVLAGIVILLHVVIATAVSVLFIGWTTFIAGVVGVVISIVSIGKEGFWTGLLGGALLTVLGLVMVRNPGVPTPRCSSIPPRRSAEPVVHEASQPVAKVIPLV